MRARERDPLADVHAEAATRWLVAARGAASAAEREAFLAWLRESPRHVEAYLRVAAESEALGTAARAWPEDTEALVAAARAAPDEEPLAFPGAAGGTPFAAHRVPAPVAPPHGARARRRRVVGFAAAAAVALLAIGVGWRAGAPDPAVEQRLRTAHGEQGSWPLPDGSTLHLNSDSTALVRFDGAERRVELQSGQATFQVAKDPRRRFRVVAGDASLIAVGTAFDVRRDAGRATLVVLEGRVAVARGAVPDTGWPADALVVDAGRQLDLRRADARPEPADLRRAAAWVQREIVFEATPLAEVAAEFNRYTAVPIEVEGAALRGLPVTGVFGAYDVESFLAFVARLDGVVVERAAVRIRVYERAGPG